MKISYKGLLLWLGRFCIGAAVLGLMSYMVRWDDLLKTLRVVPLWGIVFGVGVSLVRIFLSGERWRTLNPDQTLGRFQCFRQLMINQCMNIFMPGFLGGDIARSAMVASEVEENKSINVLSVFVDRAVGLFSILLMGLGALLVATDFPQRPLFLLCLGAVIAGIVVAVVVAYRVAGHAQSQALVGGLPWVGGKLVAGALALRSIANHYRERPVVVLGALAYCLPIHGLWFLVVYVYAGMLGIDLSFFSVSVVTCLAWVVTLLPLSFGGLGVREMSYVGLLSMYEVPSEAAVALSLYQFMIGVLSGFLGIPFFLWWRGLKANAAEEEGSSS